MSTLTELTIGISAEGSNHIDLVPLMRLANLTRFTIQYLDVPPQQLQQLAMLCYLSARDNRWNHQQLQALCTDPTALVHLQELNLRSSRVNKTSMEALARLPTLTTLQPLYMGLDALPLLSHFPLLVSLRLGFDLYPQEALLSLLLPSLRACAQLTDLEMVVFTADAADLIDLASALPLLRTLVLSDMGWTPGNELNFSGLQSLRHLESLTIERCQNLRVAHLLHLRPIATLRNLTARVVYADMLERMEVLDSPSALLPQLTTLNLRY